MAIENLAEVAPASLSASYDRGLRRQPGSCPDHKFKSKDLVLLLGPSMSLDCDVFFGRKMPAETPALLGRPFLR